VLALHVAARSSSRAVGRATLGPIASLPQLGKLERIPDLRAHWPSEERDFTPWLAQNLDLLAETLGLGDLVLIQTEKKVGPFEADIYARAANGEEIVVVENQLERTNHSHLGQLLVYSAGLEAQTIVWIASEFSDEYRNTLDWLNRTSEEGVNYFGIEVELWQIGPSEPAPRLNVVSQPNEWQKAVRDKSHDELTETKQLQLEFWRGFVDYARGREAPFNLRKPRPQHWYDFGVGRAGFGISLTMNTPAERLGCELYIGHGAAKTAFALLAAEKEVIEGALGKLDWRELPERQASRVIQYQENVVFADPEKWPVLHEWSYDRVTAFQKVFGPRIQTLDLTASEPSLDGDELGEGSLASKGGS
jgi:hypothetical protein